MRPGYSDGNGNGSWGHRYQLPVAVVSKRHTGYLFDDQRSNKHFLFGTIGTNDYLLRMQRRVYSIG